MLVFNFPAEYVLVQHSIGLSFCKSRSKSILDSSAEKKKLNMSLDVQLNVLQDHCKNIEQMLKSQTI